MTHRGRIVRTGVVELNDPESLPVGLEVSVRPLRRQSKRAESKTKRRSAFDALRPFIGVAKGLPKDMSVNHDHYLYGTPKAK
ncbi:MAG: hypothetical protein ACE15C_06885 [Phycisphaerae bacterium]